jgi:hypothetical protein
VGKAGTVAGVVLLVMAGIGYLVTDSKLPADSPDRPGAMVICAFVAVVGVGMALASWLGGDD